MSTPQPPRRRRIAGESKPGVTARKPPVVKKRETAKPRPESTTTAPKPKAPKPKAPKAPAAKASPKVPAAAPATPDTPVVAEASRARRFSLPNVSGRFGALVALAVAAVVFGAVFGVRGFQEWRSDGSIVEAHEQAAGTAASAGETIFTYQYNQLADHLRDAKATMTPDFAEEFESIAPALQDLAPQRKVQVKATVRNAAAEPCVSECSSDRATILVFIDQARAADDAKEPTVFGNRIEMKMVQRDGRWLVDDIKAL